MDIKCFKLVSGEEVISQCEITDDEIILSKPARMAIMNDGENRGMLLIPWVPITDPKEKISISRIHVMYIVEPVPELAQEYHERFVSLIAVPDKGEIIA